MKGSKIVVSLVTAAICALAVQPLLAEGPAGKQPIVWPAGDLKWADSPAVKGGKIAVLWGEPKKGAYGALKTIPGGSMLARHTHSHDQAVIVVSGTLALTIGSGPAKEMGPGSYLFMPAGVEHIAECKGGADCMYFEEQQGAADIKYVEKAAAPK